MQETGTQQRALRSGFLLGGSLHHVGKRKEEDASCQWGRRGEIPEATCLHRKRWRNTGSDFPMTPTQGKGSEQEGEGQMTSPPGTSVSLPVNWH